MGDTKVIFWDVYGTLLTAHRGNLDSLFQREAELRLAFERTVRNFNLNIVPARLHDLFLRRILKLFLLIIKDLLYRFAEPGYRDGFF